MLVLTHGGCSFSYFSSTSIRSFLADHWHAHVPSNFWPKYPPSPRGLSNHSYISNYYSWPKSIHPSIHPPTVTRIHPARQSASHPPISPTIHSPTSSIHSSVSPSACPSFHPTARATHPSTYPSPPTHPSIHPSIYPSIHPSTDPSAIYQCHVSKYIF